MSAYADMALEQFQQKCAAVLRPELRKSKEMEPRGLPSPREMGVWAGAAAIVLLMHVAIAYAVHGLQPAELPPEAAEPALVIDLTPLTVSTPEAIQSETAAQERPEEVVQPVETAVVARNALDSETIEADTTEIAERKTAEIVKPDTLAETAKPQVVETVSPEPAKQETTEAIAPEPIAEAIEPEKAEITETMPIEPELTAPEVVSVTPEVVAALPEPRPVVEPEPEEKPVEAKPKKKAERRKQVAQAERPKKAEAKKAETKKAAKAEKAEKDAKQKVAKAEAAPAPKSAASVESRASKAKSVSPAKWQSRVVAWLNRHKRYPRGAGGEQGMVNVAFAINASGSVLSVRIARSSGNAELDKAALDMVRRASPVPAPPPEIAKSRMNLAMPVQFIVQ